MVGCLLISGMAVKVIKVHFKISEVFFYTAPAYFVMYGSDPGLVLNGVTKSTTIFCTSL
jgi:hypothetical protein